MLYLVVFSVLATVHTVRAGYDYPKPSVPFQLPNHLLHSGRHFEEQTIEEHQQTTSYSIPYEDYNYLQQHKNENGYNIIQSSSAINSPQQNPKISALRELTRLEPITTELNANIDGAVPIQSTVVQSHVIKEPGSINAQAILNAANNPQVLLTSPKIVSASENPQTTESRVLNTQNIQGSNLLKVANNVPSLFHIDNVPNLLSAHNNLSPVLNLLGNNAPLTNEQNHRQRPDVANVPTQLFNIQNTNHRVVSEYNQVPFNSNYDIPLTNLPLEQTPRLLNVQNSVVDITNNGAPQLLEAQNNLQIINYQSDTASVQNNVHQSPISQNLVEPVITKHIYFHVPPPDIEETPVVRASLPPKKVYKIVFIKLPEQQFRKNAQLQAALQNQLAPIEDKTLIYVLSKKPEPTEVVLHQPKLSEHEVLFVKYKGSLDSQNLEPLVRSNAFQNDELTLQPGLVNGNK